ncbi:MAG: TonB-dependent receptor [Oceanicaulis sp.]
MKRTALMLGAASALALAAATAANAAEITGRITEATGDIGLQGAIVRIVETGQTTTTDRQGEFRFANVPAGDYTLEVSYLGADEQTRQVVVASEFDTVTTNFTLGMDVMVSDNILVVGQRGQLTSAINRQRAADNLITVLSSDAIGAIPDENVAEAARRAPGVNVINDQGEGRYVSIRGLDPNFVTSSFNGVRLPSPEAGDRQVPLDVVDADVLSAIEITKTLTPDMPGDTIGGNIEIETLSGLDQTSRLLRARAAGIYTDLVEETGYRGSLTFADQFNDGKLGLAISLAHQNRPFGSENFETDAEWETGAATFPNEVELRDYLVERERTTLAVNLDFAPDAETELFIRSIYSDFSDQEFRTVALIPFGDGVVDPASTSTLAVLNAEPGDEIEIERELKDRLETQTIYSIAAGGERTAGLWIFDAQGSYSKASEVEDNALYSVFVQEFDSGSFTIDTSNPELPSIGFANGAGAGWNDASGYEFDGFELVDGETSDEEWAFEANAERDFGAFGGSGFIKFGGQVRLREKGYEADVTFFEDFAGGDLFLDQFRGEVDYPFADFGPAVDAGAIRDFFNQNRNQFEIAEIDTAVDSNVENYEANEDIYAAYVMHTVEVNDLQIVYGVRVEDTEYDAVGNQVDVIEEGEMVDGVTFAEDTVVVSQTNAANSYTDWLPSVNLRYTLSDQLIARASYYASIVRPNPEQAAPFVQIERSGGDVEGEAGNPDLDRAQADNFDASLEYYPNRDSVLSANVFYKRIENFIAGTAFDDVTLNGVDLDELETFINLDEADLMGFELNYQQALTQLPGLLSGLIVGANYTYVNSEVTLPDGREIPVPGQSENVANLILGYENGPLDLRIAASYRDRFLDGINEGGDGIDRYANEHLGVDFSAKYDFTENFQGFLEFKNITDEPFVAVVETGGRSLNSQYEEYGWTAIFGASARF